MDYINSLRNSLRKIYRKTRWKFFWNNFQLPIIELIDFSLDIQKVVPVIFDELCLPPYHGPKDHDDITPLLSLIKQLNPEIVLEIGTAHGATVANICAVSKANIITINALPEQIEGNITTYTLTKDEIGSVYRKYGYEDRVVQIYANSWGIDMAQYLNHQKVDFVIVDGCHDTEFVLNDFLSILPIIKPHAVVLFHDIGLRNPDPMTGHLDDGYIACMYLRKMGYNIQLIKGTWWSVWQAKCPKTHHNPWIRTINKADNLFRVKRRSIFREARLFRLYHDQFQIKRTYNDYQH